GPARRRVPPLRRRPRVRCAPMAPVVALPPPPPQVAVHAGAFVRTSAPHGWGTHVVRPGETLFGIALRHHTSVQALVAKNHLAGGGRIILSGSHLKVPRTKAAQDRDHGTAQRS